MREVDRSNREVSRAVPAFLRRGWIAVLAAIAALGCAQTARASGCHVSERPVLALHSAWDINLTAEPVADSTPVAPPVLRHPPCEGDTARTVEALTSISAITTLDGIILGLPVQSGTVTVSAPSLHAGPPDARIDRPPRAL